MSEQQLKALLKELEELLESDHEPDSSDNMPPKLRFEYDGGYYNGSQIVKWQLRNILRKYNIGELST